MEHLTISPTSAVSTRDCPGLPGGTVHGRQSASGGRIAFTLIEMLVVIGIIFIMVGILLPTLARARRQAEIASQKMDFVTISQALQAYKGDFGSLPGNWDWNGSSNYLSPGTLPGLADALLGSVKPTSVQPINGFHTIIGPDGLAKGRTYGPYLDAGKFRSASASTASGVGNHLVDRWGGPIMYYPVRAMLVAAAGQNGKLGPITMTQTSPQCMFCIADDLLEASPQTAIDNNKNTPANWAPVRAALGDINNDNYIDPAAGEHLTWDGPFILISGGPAPAATAIQYPGSALSVSFPYWGFDSWGTANGYADQLTAPYSAGVAGSPNLANPVAAKSALLNTCHNIYNFDP